MVVEIETMGVWEEGQGGDVALHSLYLVMLSKSDKEVEDSEPTSDNSRKTSCSYLSYKSPRCFLSLLNYAFLSVIIRCLSSLSLLFLIKQWSILVLIVLSVFKFSIKSFRRYQSLFLPFLLHYLPILNN